MVNPEVVTVLSALLESLPGVVEKKTAVHATFLVKKKIFAFTRSTGEGVALKLSSERIAVLMEQDGGLTPMTMGKRTMKEWVLLRRGKAVDYRKDLALFREAMDFVAAGKKK